MEENNGRNLSFILFLIFVTVGLGLILINFFFPVFWAAVIAILFKPIYDRLCRHLKGSLAAGLLLLAIVLMVFLPLAFLGVLLFGEAARLIESLSDNNLQLDQLSKILFQKIDRSALFLQLGLSEAFLMERISDAIRALAAFLMAHLSDITQNTLALIVKFFIMLYCLFFFLKDGDRLVGRLADLNPFDRETASFLRQKMVAAVNVIIRATLIIGGIQGLLGGVIFYITGIEGAVLWGALMVLCSLIPAVGTAIIWAPAGVIMLLTGHLWEGVVILVAGFALIGLADNLLRPILIGREADIHPLLIFLSTLGGIMLFGLSGLLLGPLLAALFLAAWSVFFHLRAESRLGEDQAAKGNKQN